MPRGSPFKVNTGGVGKRTAALKRAALNRARAQAIKAAKLAYNNSLKRQNFVAYR